MVECLLNSVNKAGLISRQFSKRHCFKKKIKNKAKLETATC